MNSGQTRIYIKLIRAVSIGCICVLICGAWSFLGNLCKDKIHDGTSHLYNFYKLEKNTVDVLMLGSSHVYCGINPNLLYDNYGIASFNMSSGGQTPWVSFFIWRRH